MLNNVESRNYDTLSRLMGRGGVKVDSTPVDAGRGGASIYVYPRESHSETKIAASVKKEFDWEARLG